MNAVNVVIVEDEFLVALQLEDIVEDSGHRLVATVPDFASATLINKPVDVALVDLNLRDGPTGPAIARMLSERFGARIVYVTANSGQIGAPAPTALGVIHKPFSRQTIEAAILYAGCDDAIVDRPAELQPLGSDGPVMMRECVMRCAAR